MDYSYPEVEGKIVGINDLKFPRSKSLALAALNNPTFFLRPIFIKNDKKEIILLCLDVEAPFRNNNGIEEQEDIAIICEESDKNFPEVFALRADFPLGLPHTNLRLTERPVSLCVSEQDFSEVKIGFNAYSFIESIRAWLCQTAQGKLHREDQPLEPFMIMKGRVMLPVKRRSEDSYLKPINLESFLYQLTSDPTNTSISSSSFNFDTQVHGFVHKEPKYISDLSKLLTCKGESLASLLAKSFNNIKQEVLSNSDLHNKYIGLLCFVPIKRNAEDTKPEKEEIFFLLTKKTFKEIGTKSLIWRDNLDGTLSEVSEMSVSFKEEHFDDIEIEMYGIMWEFNSESASIYNGLDPNNNKYVAIGVGALGSQIMEIFARMGFGEWTIVDHDRLYPHNLARHTLSQQHLGEYKAASVAQKLNDLLVNSRYRPLNLNFIDDGNDPELMSALTSANAIIDISTSIAVARSLARDYTKSVKNKRISVFMNPAGTDLVILAEDNGRKHRLDFLEMEYYRYLYHIQDLHCHLKTKGDKDTRIRYNTNSCRDITTIMNQADVSMLASIAAKSLQSIIKDGKAHVGIWRTAPDGSVCKYDFKPTNWVKKISTNSRWTLYVNNGLINQIQEVREAKLPNETGGILLGCIDDSRSIIYLFDTILAPGDSKAAPTFFERGKEGILDEFNKYQEITVGQVKYLGEWHSHPRNSSTQPSEQDLIQCAFLAEHIAKEGSPVYICICGDKKLSFHLIDNYSKLSDGSDGRSFTLEVFV